MQISYLKIQKLKQTKTKTNISLDCYSVTKVTSTLKNKASSPHLPVFVSHLHYHWVQFYLLVALPLVALPLVALPFVVLPLVGPSLVGPSLVGPSLTVLVSTLFGVLVEVVDS